jgi:hypothetical protein
MALFIRQNDNRSQLQERLAAELQERAKQNASKADLPDGVTDSDYMKDTKQTTNLVWLWILIALALIGVTIWLTLQSTKA